MSMNPKQEPPRGDPTPTQDELQKLTSIPVEALKRAIAHDLDSGNPLILSEEESKIAIAQAMREAMTAQEMSVYHLHEKTRLPCEVIEALMNGTGDISDSDPIQRIEVALRVRLCHL